MSESHSEPEVPVVTRPRGMSVGHRRRQLKQMIPSSLTLSNGICGVTAIMQLTEALVHIRSNELDIALTYMTYACWLIVGGGIFDLLDGKVARLTSTTGAFGAELDSLTDAVSFGVAPALFLRTLGEFILANHSIPTDSFTLWLGSITYICCTLIRLARFNVETTDDDDHSQFKGLPSPAAAFTVLSTFFLTTFLWQKFEVTRGEPYVSVLRLLIPGMGIFCGLMMVSSYQYSHVVTPEFIKRGSPARNKTILVAFLGCLLAGAIAMYKDEEQYWKVILPSIVLAYVLTGPIIGSYRAMRRGVHRLRRSRRSSTRKEE